MAPAQAPARSAESQTDVQKRHWEQDKCGRRSPDHPVVKALYAPRAEFIASLVENSRNADILDVGCGNGFLTAALESRFGRVVGLDYSREMLRVNPARAKCRGSAMSLPFADNAFDVVVESHLLHHLEEPDRYRAVAEMGRVARRAVVLYEPNRNNLLTFAFGVLKKEERMALRFSRRYVSRLLGSLSPARRFVRNEGMIVPNMAPRWWVPIGSFLEKSPLRALGFDVCGVGELAAPGMYGPSQ